MADAFIVRRSGGSSSAAVSGYIFKDGDEYSHITGGWIKHSGFGTLSNNGSALVMHQPAASYSSHYGMFRTANPIDISSCDTVTVECDTISPYVDYRLKLTIWTSGDQVAAQTNGKYNTTSISCDISALTGKHYIGFYLYNYWDGVAATGITAYVKSVKI